MTPSKSEMEKKIFPLWNAIAMFGSLLAAIGFFMNMFSTSMFGLVRDYGSGIDMLADNGLTPMKVIPLIIALLAVVLFVYAAFDMRRVYGGRPLPVNFPISAGLSAAGLALSIVLIVSVSSKAIFEINIDGMGISIGVGIWSMLTGFIICIGAAILSKYNPAVDIVS